MAATIGRLRAVLSANTTEFNQGFEKAKNAIKGLDSSIRKTQRNLRRFARTTERIGSNLSKSLSLPIVGFGTVALKAAADAEKLRVQLETLTGSAEEGGKAFERLKTLSAKTPFELEDLVSANNTLLGFSLSSTEAYSAIQDLGDIAAVTGGDLQSIAVAFGQSAAEGKLFTKDIRQFINNGVPAVKLLAEEMNVAESEVFDLASQGTITFDILKNAFKSATAEGGMFANGMAKQSGTLLGLFSTLKDSLRIALGDIGEQIVQAFDLKNVLGNLISNINKIRTAFNNLSDEIKNRIIIITTSIAAIGPALIGLAITIKGMAALAGVFRIITTAIKGIKLQVIALKVVIFAKIIAAIAIFAALAAAVQYVKDNVEAFKLAFKLAFEVIKKAVVDFTSFMISKLKEIFEKLNTLPLLEGKFNLQITGLTAFENKLEEVAKNAQSNIDKIKTDGIDFETPAEFASRLGDKIVEVKDKVLDYFKLGDKSPPMLDFDPNNKIEATTQKIEGLVLSTKKLTISAQDLKDQMVDTSKMGIAFYRNEINKLKIEMDLVETNEEWEALNTILQDFINKIKEIQGVTDKAKSVLISFSPALTSFGETLGDVFSGKIEGAKELFGSLLMIVADFMDQLGKSLIATMEAVQFFKNLLKSNPFAAIAAGVALVAAAAWTRAKIAKGLGGGGKETSVNDALITSKGQVIKFHPNDNILAMKDFGKLGGIINQQPAALNNIGSPSLNNIRRMQPIYLESSINLDGRQIYKGIQLTKARINR
jgi:tape measure domain-containing protein